MQWRLAFVFALVCPAGFAQGLNWTLFGSAGTEADATPANPRSPINPGGLLNLPGRADNTDITLFGNIAPEDNAWKFHFKLRAEGDYSRESFTRFDVDEAYWSVSVTPWLDIELGRKIEKWGTGYAWNPTGVVNPPKNPQDPNDRRYGFRGVDMLAVNLQASGWAITLLGLPDLNWNGHTGAFVHGAGWAARAYRLMRGTDVAITASGGPGQARSSGLSLARVFGNALELHGEVAYFERSAPESGLQLRRHYSEVLAGGQYTFPHNVNIVAEYLYRGDGLSAVQWAEYQQQVAAGQEQAATGNPGPLLTAAGSYVPLSMSRNYAFTQVSWPIRLNKLTVQTLIVQSLRDGSAVIEPGVFWKITPVWSTYLVESEFIGSPQTEVGYSPVRHSVQLGIRYSFSFKKGS